MVDNSIRNALILPQLGIRVSDVIKDTIISIIDYLPTMTACSTDVDAVSCLQTGSRMLNLIKPMESVQQLVIPLVILSKSLCLGASGLLDVVLYPFFDVNLAKGVHNIVNAFLFTFVQMPIVTYQRCKMYGGNNASPGTTDVIYCLPDFHPITNLLSAGLRNLGQLVDNWIDVTSVIVERSIFGTGPECLQVG